VGGKEGVRAGGEMTQALYAHMNNNNKKENCSITFIFCVFNHLKFSSIN
jgi:hypothetical protein